MPHAKPEGRVDAETLDGVRVLKLVRPPLNVIDVPMAAELEDALEEAAADPMLFAVVLRGDGDKFSAGVDLHDHRPERAEAMLRAVHAVVRALVRSPHPTIASVRGPCLGGALELCLACDVVVATPDATFALPETSVGCFPPAASVLLRRRVGDAAAADMILTGRAFSGEEAVRAGLASELDAVRRDDRGRVCEALATRSRVALRAAVRAMRPDPRLLDEELRRVEEIYKELLSTFDVNEGVDAFFERRPPRWRHA
jgi:cyclohexa-1,5-dienecarbonyl-CoA hydratase